jgi:hypothetical protein
MVTLVAGAGLVGHRPVMWVTRFEFVVNPQSAKVFGIDGLQRFSTGRTK